MEASTAAVFLVTAAVRQTFAPVADVLLFVLLALFLALAAIDLRRFILPDVLVSGVAVVGLLRSIVLGMSIRDLALGAAAGAALLGVLALFKRRDRSGTRAASLGWGDVKLASALGLALGPGGLFAALSLAVLAGGAVGAVLLLSRLAQPGSRIAFGPFLLGAATLVLWFPGLPGALVRVLRL